MPVMATYGVLGMAPSSWSLVRRRSARESVRLPVEAAGAVVLQVVELWPRGRTAAARAGGDAAERKGAGAGAVVAVLWIDGCSSGGEPRDGQAAVGDAC